MQARLLELPSGIWLNCWLAGDPGADPVVALHALGEAGTDWSGVVPSLVEAGYRVIAPDLRGHGASDWPGEYSYETLRDDVLGLFDALELQSPVVIGHSLGGAIAMAFAQTWPERVSRLVIEDAPLPFPRERACPPRPDRELPFDWAVIEAVYRQMNDPDRRWWPGLAQITAPSLMIGGGPSSTVPQEELARVADTIPNCELVTIDAGHCVHEDKPEEFNGVLIEWLARTRP